MPNDEEWQTIGELSFTNKWKREWIENEAKHISLLASSLIRLPRQAAPCDLAARASAIYAAAKDQAALNFDSWVRKEFCK